MKKQFSLSEAELKAFRENGFAGPFDVYEPGEMTETYKKLRAEIFDRSHAV